MGEESFANSNTKLDNTSDLESKEVKAIKEETADDEEEADASWTQHIPDDFYYDLETIIAKPHMSLEGGLSEDVVQLYHSFGCDTFRRDNLKILGANSVGFVVGNYFEICNLISGERNYLRSTGGLGIGAVDVHPEGTHIAIAEKGELPNVCIYEYPSLKLFRILREGTQAAYPSCQFTPDGSLIATVGDEPDYLLTIWDWREERIVLRNKVFSQEIFRVRWSDDLRGVLVTAGLGHIRFWKMAKTFTGLKLQGNIGKFGKVELSDIEGFVILPDGKVLSGCEWGNLLLWEGNLIKVQVCRKDGSPCHDGLIMHILIYEGELFTIGTDGYVRTWEFEAIDQAEAQEEGTFLELEPMNEMRISPHAKLTSLQKVEDEGTVYWYCMDANDGIWKLDLSFSHISAAPQLILPYHAGAILDCAVAPNSHLAATLGFDGSVRIFDIPKKATLGCKRFNACGHCLIWAPTHVDPEGKTILAGFADGVVRVMQIASNGGASAEDPPSQTVTIELIQVLKPHTDAIMTMDYDPKGVFFATASADKTVFIFHVDGLRIVPSGFVRIPTKAMKIQWRYSSLEETKPTLLLLLDNSCVIEVVVPFRKAPEKGTFEITDAIPIRGFQMESVAGGLRVVEKSFSLRVAYEEAKKKRQENTQRLLNEGLINEEDLTKAMEDEKRLHAKLEEELSQLKAIIPEKPSPIIGGMVCREDPNLIWINMDNFDAGYMYKCNLMDLMDPAPKTEENQDDGKRELTELETVLPRVRSMKPLQSTKIVDCNDSPLLSWKFCRSGSRVVMGFQNGLLRVQMLEEAFDFSRMGAFWTYAFSDNERGAVNGVQLTFDDRFLLTVAGDGTFFALELMSESMQTQEVSKLLAKLPSSSHEPAEEDIQDANEFSIEQARGKMEWDKLVETGEEKKRETRKQLAELRLRFRQLKEQNDRLPFHMRVNSREYEMLERLRDQLMNQRQEQIAMLDKEMEFQSRKGSIALQKMIHRFRKDLACEYIVLKAFGTNDWVSSIRKAKLPPGHFVLMQLLKEESRQDREAEMESRRKTITQDKSQPRVTEVLPASNFDLLKRSKVKGARGLRYMRQLETLEVARLKREKRRQQWEELYAKKPTNKWEDPLDVAAIEFVKNNMGDFKLKSSSSYSVPEHLKPTATKSRLALLEAITQISQRQDDFNQRLLKLRNKKAIIIKELKNIDESLKQLSEDIPPDSIVVRLKIDNLDDDEFPERAFDATDSALEAYKKSVDFMAPSEDGKLSPLKKTLSNPDELRSECVPDSSGLNVVMHDNRRVLFVSTARLIEPKSFYTLDIPLPHRSEIVGLPLYSMHSEEQLLQPSAHVLLTRQPLQPDSMVDTIDEEDSTKGGPKSLLEDATTRKEGEHSTLFESSDSQDSEDHLNFEMDRQKLHHERALYKQQYLITEAGAMVRCFNMELRTLSHQKVNLDLLMRRANLNLLILYKEYKLLTELEKAELGLATNFEAKTGEKNEIDQKVAETEVEIEETLASLERLAVKENGVYEEFKEFLGDNHKWGDFLHKVYRKRVKRKVKGAATGEGGSSGSSSSSSSEDSEWNESDEAEENEGDDDEEDNILDLDICPSGCAQADFDQTIAFREQRLDVEDEISDQKRLLDAQRKEAEALAKRSRSAQQSLQQATMELQAFQLEKQRKLNVLERLVTLRLDQVIFFQDKSLPQDFAPILVFRHDNVTRLRRRIQALEDEKRIQRKERKQAKEKHLMLQRHKKVFQEELKKMAVKCDLMMVDKFGRLDDLEKLETIHPKVEEITLRMLALQARIQKEENEAEERLRDARDVYVAQLRENTRLVVKTLMLFNEMQTLSASMDGYIRNSNRELCEGIIKERVETADRLKILQSQAEEINKLTAEIRCLSEKAPKQTNDGGDLCTDELLFELLDRSGMVAVAG
ncbi:Cilia and flagella-associated protein 44 [Taenia crassiceps]|uniref:Cilia and flagella-associated protein 44 n=1 Tax=Taenia crassiceps TaxID=6207 RepID=A0ABR4QTB0_9CEST